MSDDAALFEAGGTTLVATGAWESVTPVYM